MDMLERLAGDATAFLLAHEGNTVRPEDAMREDLVGMRIYDAPVFAVGAAEDPLFAALRGDGAVHPDYWLPGDWVPGAQRVVAFFAPYTERVKRANAWDMRHPADEWLHARLEGERMMALLRRYVRDWLVGEGYAAVAPLADERYGMLAEFAPNWSERHTGFVCGLGTFGLSKGLITAKGVAGRIGSVVTDCALPVSARPYGEDVYGYCTRCGQCAENCPVQCIDAARGMHEAKLHPPCSRYLDVIRDRTPRGQTRQKRYGCGKCQVAVPCQNGIPCGCPSISGNY